MDEEPGGGGAHEEGLVGRRVPPRPCATAQADAMVGAGNTGATMAAALLRYRPHPGVHRPAIAVPIPVPFGDARSCSSTAARPSTARPSGSCSSPRMGRAYARVRLGVDEPTVGLLSNGEEPGKGDDAAQADATPLLDATCRGSSATSRVAT